MKLVINEYSYKSSDYTIKNQVYNVKKNHINFLVGKNGSGKTTLVDLFLGFLECDNYERNYELGNDYIYINQFLPMLGNIECSDIFQLILGLLWKNNDITLEFLKSKLDTFSFDIVKQFWDRKYKDLSGGEQKLVQMISFLQSDKSFIVLDEPTAFIDRYHVYNLFKFIESQREKTFIIITHDYRDLKIIDDYYISIIDNGQIIEYSNKDSFEKTIYQNGFMKFFKEI